MSLDRNLYIARRALAPPGGHCYFLLVVSALFESQHRMIAVQHKPPSPISLCCLQLMCVPPTLTPHSQHMPGSYSQCADMLPSFDIARRCPLRVCVALGAYRALCACCAKSRLFFTTSSHGSQGPEFCTQCCFELIMHACVGGWFSAVFPG